MEDILRAIVLGIIQGLTEFLPISSSGHLIVARDLFGWEFADDLTFDVALHVGTTAAVIVFFWREWWGMLRGGLAFAFKRRSLERSSESIYDARLLLLLALGSIPTAIVGLVFTAFLEDEVRDPIIVGVMLILFGVVLFGAERMGSRSRTIGATGWQDAVAIGLAQAASLVPGTSRSGVTISAGMARGFTRHDAARFSFLLATPAIIGAGALKTGEAIVEGIPSGDADVIAVGAVVSAVVGWMSIGWLLRLVQRSSFVPFAAYRLLAGAFVLVYFTV